MKFGDGTEVSYRAIFEDADCDDSYFDDSYVDGFTWSASEPDTPDLPFFAFSAAWRLFSFALLFWKHQLYPHSHPRNHQFWKQMTETYLEPDFHLVLCNIQSNCNFGSFCHWKIFFLVELNLQLVYLIFTEKGFQNRGRSWAKNCRPIRAQVHYWKPTWTSFDDMVFVRVVFSG